MNKKTISQDDRDYCEAARLKCELYGVAVGTLAEKLGINRVTVWRKLHGHWPFSKCEKSVIDEMLKREEGEAATRAARIVS